MDFKTLLDWHCAGYDLTKYEIDELEKLFIISIDNNINNKDIAPNHICEACCVEENSLWLLCLANVLDKLKPLKKKIGKRTILLQNNKC